MNKVRVMIVEDSPTARALLQHVIDSDPRLEVAASCASGEEALRELERVSPDVISMDIRLPGMNGLEATQAIMARKPTPIVVVSATVQGDDLNISMNALRAGALAVVEKPAGKQHQAYEALAGRLCTQLAIMSQVKVIRQRIDRGVRFGPESSTPQPIVPAHPAGTYRMLGIVASTGGPTALATLLGALPPHFPLPIVLVQHITACFLSGFVSWLDSVSPLRVQVAGDGAMPLPGRIYVPAAERHLRLVADRLYLDDSPPVALQRPSGTVLLQSLAASLGPGALGVLLTGMGEDGAQGLRALRDAGGYTIAEDESTAVVYGMPAAAVRLGGACESLPLPEIGPRILELLG